MALVISSQACSLRPLFRRVVSESSRVTATDSLFLTNHLDLDKYGSSCLLLHARINADFAFFLLLSFPPLTLHESHSII
jgi:hypothetical protein